MVADELRRQAENSWNWTVLGPSSGELCRPTQHNSSIADSDLAEQWTRTAAATWSELARIAIRFPGIGRLGMTAGI